MAPLMIPPVAVAPEPPPPEMITLGADLHRPKSRFRVMALTLPRFQLGSMPT